MRQFFICFSAAMLWSCSAFALTCANGSTATGCTGSTNTAADCKALGYTREEVPNCNHYLRCPFDENYKICVSDPQGSQCPDGYSLSVTKDSCGTALGWKFLTNGKVSTYDCGKCECAAPAECSWDSSNKGTANLSDACCNGKSKTCTSTCKEVTIPANATATTTCTGCNKTVNTAFKCNDGYDLSADGKSCAKATTSACSTCPEGTTFIKSGDEITGPGSYCIGGLIKFDKRGSGSGEYTFYPGPGCGGEQRLVISGNTDVKSITSYVYATIGNENGARIFNLELHAGGGFLAPLVCGTYSVSGNQCYKNGENCKVKLYGNYTYSFGNFNVGAPNLPPIVSCSLEGGNPTTKPKLRFEADASDSHYLFTGNSGTISGGVSCSLGSADGSCLGVTCTAKSSSGNTITGTMKSYNSCY